MSLYVGLVTSRNHCLSKDVSLSDFLTSFLVWEVSLSFSLVGLRAMGNREFENSRSLLMT